MSNVTGIQSDVTNEHVVFSFHIEYCISRRVEYQVPPTETEVP